MILTVKATSMPVAPGTRRVAGVAIKVLKSSGHRCRRSCQKYGVMNVSKGKNIRVPTTQPKAITIQVATGLFLRIAM